MSFLKNLTNALKSGRVNSLKDVTDLAADSMGQNDSPFAKKEITDDMLTSQQLQVSRMHWDWREAGQSDNKGSGNAVKNWEVDDTDKDIFLVWSPENQAIEEYVAVLAWSGWATALIMRDSRKFIPEYVDAVMGDQLSTVRIVRFAAAQAPNHAVCFPASDNNRFVYLKLLGKTAAGDYAEISDYTLGSHDKRTASKLSAVPEGEIPHLAVPAGSRESNDVEKQFERQ